MTKIDDLDAGDTGDSPPATPAVPVDQQLQQFAEYAKSLQVEDPEEVQRRILENLMRATTKEDILRAGEATPSEQVLNVPLRVETIRASESTFVDGADLYLHIDAVVISNGDHVTVSCGARDVCVKLIRLHQLGMLPVDVRIERADRPTKEGFYPLFLRPIDTDGKPF